MSKIKERIFGAVSIMSDEDAQKVWELILSTFALNNIEADQPDPEEQAALEAYQNGDPDYQPPSHRQNFLKRLI